MQWVVLDLAEQMASLFTWTMSVALAPKQDYLTVLLTHWAPITVHTVRMLESGVNCVSSFRENNGVLLKM